MRTPSTTTQLDLQHPLNRRMVGCFVKPSSLKRIRNLIRPVDMVLGSGTSLSLQGPMGHAVNFSSGTITVDNSIFSKIDGLPTGVGVTIGLWIYPTNITGYRSVFDTTNRQCSFFINSATEGYLAFGTGAGVTFSQTWTTNEWQYIVVTYNGVTATVYRNGAFAGSHNLTGTAFNEDLLFGASPSGSGTSFAGKQAGWRIWSQVFSPGEVAALYQQAKKGFSDTYRYLGDVAPFKVDLTGLHDRITTLYLGRYRRGGRLPLIVTTSVEPDACPLVEIWHNATTLVKSIRLPDRDSERTVFAYNQFIDSSFVDGHYVAAISYILEGRPTVKYRYFEVIGGDSQGCVVSVIELRRPLGKAVIGQREDGRVSMGYNPRIK